jgi:hypothetical protein
VRAATGPAAVTATKRTPPKFAAVITFGRLEAVSIIHSCIYLSLLICAFALGNPQPATFIFGLSHGLIWIAMSLVCIAAARWRVIPFWLAVTVAILGGLGPFFGSIGFIVEARRRARRLRPAANLDR